MPDTAHTARSLGGAVHKLQELGVTYAKCLRSDYPEHPWKGHQGTFAYYFFDQSGKELALFVYDMRDVADALIVWERPREWSERLRHGLIPEDLSMYEFRGIQSA